MNLIKTILTRLKHLRMLDVALVVGVVVAALAFVFFFFRSNSYITVTVKVGDDNVYYAGPGLQPWFNFLYHKGMTEKNGLGTVSAEVLDVWSYRTSSRTDATYLTMKLLVTKNRASGQYVYRGKTVAVAGTIRLFLDGVLADGLITHIEGIPDKREHVKIRVDAELKEETDVYPETSGARPSVVDALSVGQVVTDNHNRPIITIVDKKIAPAKRLIVTSSGSTIIGTNPLRESAVLTMDLNVTKINGKYYLFDDVPVLIGWSIPINLPSLSVEPEIIRMSELP